MLKEIFIDINGRSSDSIMATESDNNSDAYKIVLTENNRRVNLTDKTINMVYILNGSKDGEIVELNITNSSEGEITLIITDVLTKKEGNYTCQIVILGEDNYRKHTNYFTLSIKENLFNKISGEIIESPNIDILQELVKKSEFLNAQLENKNDVAESLNANLNKNISAADPLNNSLSEKISEAAAKKTELESSIIKTKEFIDGLDGSQNIPQIRLDVTDIQNGLKSNQALEYTGSSIAAENTLEGRTEGMRIKGKTLLNIHSKSNYSFATSIPQENYTLSEGQNFCEVTIKKYPSSSYYYINAGTINFDLLKPNQKYTLLAKATDGLYPSVMTGGYEFPLTSGGTSFKNGVATMTTNNLVNGSKGQILYISLKGGATYKQEIRDVMIFEGDLSIIPDNYFEGLKSFGEAEQEGDKYKISILSCGKNLFNCNLLTPSSDQITNFKIDGSIISGNFNRQYNSTKSVEFAVTTKVKVLIKAYLKGCRLIINKCWLENGEFRSIIDTNNWSNNEAQELLGSRIVYIDKNSSLKVENPHQSAHSFSARDLICYKVDGTENESYLPYRQDKKDILIKEPLRSVNDVKDVMYEDNGQVKVNRKVGKYTFTGDERWTLGTQSSGWGEFDDTLVFYLDPFKAKTNTRFICDKFAYKNVVNINEVGIYNNVWGNKPHPVIRIKKSELSTPDLEGFKSWLKANPTTIVYQLATPVTEIVENCIDIDLDTYQEKTYFNILNSLPGTLDFKVPSNIGSLVQSNAKEINNINEFINNFILKALLEMNKDLAAIKIKNGLN
ncbi:MAG: phage baseplate upper protein [Cetobacterium sp.]|nr:phage baseplate upper protein [Cetobacterium sp.]